MYTIEKKKTVEIIIFVDLGIKSLNCRLRNLITKLERESLISQGQCMDLKPSSNYKLIKRYNGMET
jgi:hypothetical protein